MFAAYCSSLNEDKKTPDAEKSKSLLAYATVVRMTMAKIMPRNGAGQEDSKASDKTVPIDENNKKKPKVDKGHGSQTLKIQGEFQAYELERRKFGNSINFFKTQAPLRYRVWLREAENGNAMAQVLTGLALDHGAGIKQDITEAFKWYVRAADQGNSAGQFNTGMSYYMGQGVIEDNTSAEVFYSEAAKQNHTGAIAALGDFYRYGYGGKNKDSKKALTFYLRAADLGETNAMREAAEMLKNGENGIVKDEELSYRLIVKAAGLGNSYAKADLLAQTIASSVSEHKVKTSTAAERQAAFHRAKMAIGELKSLNSDDFSKSFHSCTNSQNNLNQLFILEPDDPMREIKDMGIDLIVDRLSNSKINYRLEFLTDFNTNVADAIEQWRIAGDHQKVTKICNDTLKDVNISDQINGNRYGMLKFINSCVLSFFSIGFRDQAMKTANDTTKMIDQILSDRPWDFYMKDAARKFNFDIGAALDEIGEKNKSQEYLIRAWNSTFISFDRNDLIGKYSPLPLKGAIPTNPTGEDKKFFENYIKNSKEIRRNIIIDINIKGSPHPVNFYIFSGKQGYNLLQDQFVWLKEYKGVNVPNEIIDLFIKLNKITKDFSVDFLSVVLLAIKKEDSSDNKCR